MRTLPLILHVDSKQRLDAESAHIEECVSRISLPRTLLRLGSRMPKSAAIAPSLANRMEKMTTLPSRVEVPVTSVCPCSKAISDYGAHNQRGYVTLEVRTRKNRRGEWEILWIEELIEIVERSGFAPVYALLKRPDERHVTMQAYDNPVFVEDVVSERRPRVEERQASSPIRRSGP